MVKMFGIKMTDKELTQDLFGVEDCSNCNGSGIVIEEVIFNEMFPMPMGVNNSSFCNGYNFQSTDAFWGRRYFQGDTETDLIHPHNRIRIDI